MVGNSFSGSLNELVFSAEQTLQNRLITNIVVHIVTAVLHHKDHMLLHPLVNMILKTDLVKVY